MGRIINAFQSSVTNFSDLPTSGNTLGDVRLVTCTGIQYFWSISDASGGRSHWQQTSPDLGTPEDPTLSYYGENKELVTILKGQAVGIHFSGVGIVYANASNNLKNAIGLMCEDVGPGFNSLVCTDGPLELADWSSVIGAVFLSAKAIYFLSTTSGMLVTVPPIVDGQIVQEIGTAVSPTILELKVKRTIIL